MTGLELPVRDTGPLRYIEVDTNPGPGHRDVAEAARELRLTRATVYNRLRSHDIPLVRWTLRPGTARVYVREADLPRLRSKPTAPHLDRAIVQAKTSRGRRVATLRFLADWWRGYTEDGLLLLDNGLSGAENDLIERECLAVFAWMERVAARIEQTKEVAQ